MGSQITYMFLLTMINKRNPCSKNSIPEVSISTANSDAGNSLWKLSWIGWDSCLSAAVKAPDQNFYTLLEPSGLSQFLSLVTIKSRTHYNDK